MGARIKKGDLVAVVAGRDKGQTGRVLNVLDNGKAIVEGVNRVKRHQSPRKYREAGIIEREAAIDASNLMPVDPETKKPTRVRFEVDKNDPSKKVRIAVKSGAALD